MKQLLLACLLSLVLTQVGLAQPVALYWNKTTINAPSPDPVPAIDATNFLNDAGAAINLTIGNNFSFSDVLNYTNKGLISVDQGIRFDTEPAGNTGGRQMASSFQNVNIATINAGGQILVSATNIVSPGSMNVGVNGLLTVTGKSVNLSRGTLHLVSLEDATSPKLGIFDQYWGVGQQTNQLASGTYPLIPNGKAASPLHTVINTLGLQLPVNVTAFGANVFAVTNQINPSNMTVQVVFVAAPFDPKITNEVRFQGTNEFAVPIIRWRAALTNNSGVLVTNDLYLSDSFGVNTNLSLVVNSFSLTAQPTFIPTNYSFSRFDPTGTNFSALPTNNAVFDPLLLGPLARTTNDYAGYSVSLQPVTAQPDPSLPTANITNTGGRIEISADQSLDLTRAKITGANYLSITCTNQFVGSANAQIGAPNMNINLGTTNGLLLATNLITPYLPRFVGTISAYSARWTNVVAGTTNVVGGVTITTPDLTNRYHLLIVDSSGLRGTSPITVQDYKLHSTNVFISDIVDISRTLLVDAERLTITSNAPGSLEPSGEINMLSTGITSSSSYPRLQYLTNSGKITSAGAVFFSASGSQPFQAFVNHGSIFTVGVDILANYFEESSSAIIPPFIASSSGPINIQADTAVLANGELFALNGDINLTTDSLTISNHLLQSSFSLTLLSTNLLTDGGNTNNLVQVGNGFNLPIKPIAGDLLGTTVSDICGTNAGGAVVNTWAGANRGCSPAGFVDNAAIGHLILDGQVNGCLYVFTGAGTNNAIYVDLLELSNFATNGPIANLPALQVDPNMMIYYADAQIGGVEVSEKLNGANGGRLCWVSNYAGIYSSTNVTYPSGKTYTLNRALVTSTNIDSNGDGIKNNVDPAPVILPDQIALSMTITNLPPLTTLISWQAPAYATNYLFSRTNLFSTNLTVVTNFVQGPVKGNITVADPVKASGPVFYQLRVDPH